MVLARRLLAFAGLFAVVLLVNAAVIQFNLMYPEQPSIYLVNQSIHSLGDLLQIYLHPQILHQNIPFFRPSGHFLLYQLLTPLFGWHNTQALFVVSFLFLALIGVLMIVLYQRLFPGYRLGGYLAFSLYLMHPALSLARVTLMHFEFAYVLFLMLSLYTFVRFCEDEQCWRWFILSMGLYVLAVTFKEPAVMLGPVMFCYWLINSYTGKSWFSFVLQLLRKWQAWLVAGSLTLISLLMGWYLVASWPGLAYPKGILSMFKTIGTINSFFIDVWGLQHDLIPRGRLPFPDLAWRTIVYPDSVRYMLWTFLLLSLASCIALYVKRDQQQITYRKSIVFLLTAAILFLVLPFAWATGGPWHYTLTLIFISLVMGFSFDYACRAFKLRENTIARLAMLPILLNLLITLQVNELNIKKYETVEDGKIGIAVNRNAVMHPPAIQSLLTPNSMIIVEDRQIHNDYLMGNGAYPFLLFLGKQDYEYVRKENDKYFLKFSSRYGGNLFRYAYLMPSIQEQLYPFKVEDMSEVPNEIMYDWLKHKQDIFCLGYDEEGKWHDKTALFKQQLGKEESERELQIHDYAQTVIAWMSQAILSQETIPYPDPLICEYHCDQDAACQGFVWQAKNMLCTYTSTVYTADKQACPGCTWYGKMTI